MKREDYKVAVNSVEEAEMFKQALLNLGEKIDECFFIFKEYTQYLSFDAKGKCWFLYHRGHSSLQIRKNITFKELVKLLVNAKEPLFIAEDDTEMYENSECHWVYENKGKWHYGIRVDFCKNHVDLVTNKSNIHKVFGSEENAHHWIEIANKPKEIEFELFDRCIKALVTKENIKLKDVGDNYTVISLKPSDIEDISHALKQLS